METPREFYTSVKKHYLGIDEKLGKILNHITSWHLSLPFILFYPVLLHMIYHWIFHAK